MMFQVKSLKENFKEYFNNFSGKIKVNVSIHMYSVATLDEVETEYSIHILSRLEWQDSRLKLENPPINSTVIEGGSWYLNRIWTPTIHVANNREPSHIMNVNQGGQLVKIYYNGTVLLIKRYHQMI